MYTDFDLRNKIIIITGGAGLLGTEFVKTIINFNGFPIILDISQKKINNLKSKLKNITEKFSVFKCNLLNERELLKIKKKILKRYLKIDGLINNAANNHQPKKLKGSLLENLKLNIWKKDIDAGLTTTFLCSKVFGTEIAKNKNGGSIINISSDLGIISPNQNIYKDGKKAITYSAVKSGLIGLTRYLSTYWVKNNVRVNCICPGGVYNNQDPNFVKRLSKLIPLNRMAKKYEYNSTIIWILSDSNKYLNGSIISIDGGRTAW